MRIAFVAFHGSVHRRRWAGFYAAAGHEMHVVTCGGREGVEAGYEVHDLGAPRFGKLGYLLKLAAARRTLAGIDPELVHAHRATSYGLIALASGRRPLVVTAHDDDVLIAPSNPVFRVAGTGHACRSLPIRRRGGPAGVGRGRRPRWADWRTAAQDRENRLCALGSSRDMPVGARTPA